MKKLNSVLLGFLCPLFLFSQNLDIEGKAIITTMDQVDTAESVVVRLTDGTLAVRGVSTLSEFQVLDISNDTIYLSDGGFVKLPVGFDGLYASLIGAPTDVSHFTNDADYLTSEVDSSVTNEIQNLSEVLASGNDAGAAVVINLGDPIDPQDAATKAYVDLLKEQILELQIAAGLAVEDVDGNLYTSIKIGNQRWMLENLKTTRYNDGTSIPKVTEVMDWDSLLTPAYCWYSNDSTTYAQTYGALYNHFVVADTNDLNVCPVGWHVPADAEWTVLTTHLGGLSIAGGKMKEAGFEHWNSPNEGATNESGFTALPGGNRLFDGPFVNNGNNGLYWSSTQQNTTFAWYRGMFHILEGAFRVSREKSSGFSVRCLKD